MRTAIAILLVACAVIGAASVQAQDYQRALARCGIDPKPRLPPMEAIEGCSAVIESGRASPAVLAQAYVNRGDAWRSRRNDIDRALADYDAAIGVAPDFAQAFASRGFVHLFARPQLDRAIADFGEALRLDPASASVLYFRGLAWSGKGEWDRAIADFDQAIRLRPAFANAWRDRGKAKEATERAARPTSPKPSASAGRERTAAAPWAAVVRANFDQGATGVALPNGTACGSVKGAGAEGRGDRGAGDAARRDRRSALCVRLCKRRGPENRTVGCLT